MRLGLKEGAAGAALFVAAGCGLDVRHGTPTVDEINDDIAERQAVVIEECGEEAARAVVEEFSDQLDATSFDELDALRDAMPEIEAFVNEGMDKCYAAEFEIEVPEVPELDIELTFDELGLTINAGEKAFLASVGDN